MREHDFIIQIAAAFEGAVADGAHGFADDCGQLPGAPPGHQRVISVDNFIEGAHFAWHLGTAEDAGWRAIVRNLSDLASAGARPVGFVWALSIPAEQDPSLLAGFLAGAAQAAREYGCPLLGGDVAKSASGLAAAVTVLGDVNGRPLLRSGAKPGDDVFVSRPLGGSAFGLEQLLAGERHGPPIELHLRPEPELQLGASLVGRASAAMDISDGLLLDLSRLCDASEVGCVLDAVDAAADPALPPGERGRALLLGGGESYALLCTAPPGTLDELAPPLIRIGRIEAEAGIRDHAGALIPVQGFDHFASEQRA